MLVRYLFRRLAIDGKHGRCQGTVEPGHRTATLLTIISTAARNDLDVWASIKRVLDQLLARSTDYDSPRSDSGKPIASRIRAHRCQ
jgi:hypothetical protein